MYGEWYVLKHDEGVRDGDAREEEIDGAEMEKPVNICVFLSECPIAF